MTAWLGLYRPTSQDPVDVKLDKEALISLALVAAFGEPFAEHGSRDRQDELYQIDGFDVTRDAAWKRLKRRGWRIHEVQVHRKRKAA